MFSYEFRIRPWIREVAILIELLDNTIDFFSRVLPNSGQACKPPVL
jgi:hypothetical protein